MSKNNTRVLKYFCLPEYFKMLSMGWKKQFWVPTQNLAEHTRFIRLTNTFSVSVKFCIYPTSLARIFLRNCVTYLYMLNISLTLWCSLDKCKQRWKKRYSVKKKYCNFLYLSINIGIHTQRNMHRFFLYLNKI